MNNKGSSMTDLDYEAGLREGRLKAIENQQRRHDDRLSCLERSIRTQEKVTYGILGAITLIELSPAIKAIL